MTDPKLNPINAYLEYCQKSGASTVPQITFKSDGPAHSPIYLAELTCEHKRLGRVNVSTTAGSKSECRAAAFKVLCQRVGLLPSVPVRECTKGDDCAGLPNMLGVASLMLPAQDTLDFDDFLNLKSSERPSDFFFWQCCKCNVINKYIFSDALHSTTECTTCGVDAGDHYALSVNYLKVEDKMYWVPKFGNKKPRPHPPVVKETVVTKVIKPAVKHAATPKSTHPHPGTRKHLRANQPKKQPPHVGKGARTIATSSQVAKAAPELAKILKAIANPKDAGDVRLPVEWNGMKSTCLQPFTKITVPFVQDGSPTSNPQTLPNTEMMAFVFPDPLCSLIYYDPNSAKQVAKYEILGTGGSAEHEDAPAPSWNLSTQAGSLLQGRTYLHTPVARAYSTYKPHGNNFYAKAYGSKRGRFFPYPKGALVYVDSTASVGTGEVHYALDRWDVKDGVILDAYCATGPILADTPVTTTLVVPEDGEYAIALMPGPSGASYADLAINGVSWASAADASPTAPAMWCQRCIPEFDTIIGSMPSIRMTGMSLEFSNTDALLYRGGKIAQLQVPVGKHWREFVYPQNPTGPYLVTPSPDYGYGLLDRLKDVDNKPAEKGSYLYRKPVDMSFDWRWQHNYTVNSGVLFDSFIPLETYSTTSFLAFAITGKLTALDGFWTVSYNCEAMTTDTTRSTDIAKADPLVIYEAQGAMRLMPQYAENPNHLSVIAAALKNGISWVAKHLAANGSKYLNIASTVGSIVA